jgi:D-threo-aldose 1-dehydrogenase
MYSRRGVREQRAAGGLVRKVLIPGTDIATSALAFGCAGLFREPTQSARMRLLDIALDNGVQHFDTSPIYGFGLSERELGQFARGRRDQITIATKFGIQPTRVGAAAGRMQAPIRRLLARAPGLDSRARSEAASPDSGPAGSLLYRADGFDAGVARRSLEASLRRLGTDYVDIYLIHEPSVGAIEGDDLRAYLDGARTSGLIRGWGAAGETPSIDAALGSLGDSIPILQMPLDFSALARVTAPRGFGPARNFYRVLGSPVARIIHYLGGDPDRSARWRTQVGANCLDPEVLARMVLLTAANSQPESLLLFTSIRQSHIVSAARALTANADASVGDGDEQAFAALLAAEHHEIFGERSRR